jgi:hypothetical protein
MAEWLIGTYELRDPLLKQSRLANNTSCSAKYFTSIHYTIIHTYSTVPFFLLERTDNNYRAKRQILYRDAQ